MYQFTSEDDETVIHNDKSVNIFTALKDLYENKNTNCATINGRVVWFDTTAWQYEDEIPAGIKERVMDRYYWNAERMFYNGNIITV